MTLDEKLNNLLTQLTYLRNLHNAQVDAAGVPFTRLRKATRMKAQVMTCWDLLRGIRTTVQTNLRTAENKEIAANANSAQEKNP
jgi:hypothetical protein